MASIYGRKFGFELEFSTEIDRVSDICREIIGDRKLKILPDSCDNYHHWQLINDFTTMSELVSPIMTFRDMPEIRRIVHALERKGVSITKKDSFHLHIWAGDVPEENIVAAWLTIEKCIKKCFPMHRRKSTWAESLMENCSKKKIIAEIFKNACCKSHDHSVTLSLQHHRDRGRNTVEFRLSEGTLDMYDIERWLKFCMLFLNYAKNIRVLDKILEKVSRIQNVNQLAVEMRLGRYPNIVRWLKQRTSLHNE